MKSAFWDRLQELVKRSPLVIDRPLGSVYPRYASVVYPFDYGYLEGTEGGDGKEIDFWRGSLPEAELDAIICTVDSEKKDAEIKLLLGCTAYEKQIILNFHNRQSMSAILIERSAP